MGNSCGKLVSAVLSLLVIVSVFLVQPIPCKADIIDAATLTISGDMVYCSNLTMPEALANIRITNTKSEGINAKVSCEFHINSNVTDVAYLAFVYPQQWRLLSPSSVGIDFDIKINNESTNYSIVTSEDMISLGLMTEPEDNETSWMNELDFVLFSYNMTALEMYTISVVTNSWGLYAGEVQFSYVVASAKTFEGNTHQTVIMHLIQEMKLISYSFSPSEYLTQSTNQTGKIASWDMIIDDEFNINNVSFHGVLTRRIQYVDAATVYLGQLVLGTAGFLVIIIGASIIWIRRPSTQSLHDK